LWPPPRIDSGRPLSRANLTHAGDISDAADLGDQRRLLGDHGVPDRAGRDVAVVGRFAEAGHAVLCEGRSRRLHPVRTRLAG
jgi:hypothetical protein